MSRDLAMLGFGIIIGLMGGIPTVAALWKWKDISDHY